MRCSCGHTLAPSEALIIGAYVTPDVYLLLVNCPTCSSTVSLKLWESEEFAIEGAIDPPCSVATSDQHQRREISCHN